MEQPFRFGVVPALRGARVLLVEDDVLLLMELEAILREAGAEIAGCCGFQMHFGVAMPRLDFFRNACST
jgi:hypothetical protein